MADVLLLCNARLKLSLVRRCRILFVVAGENGLLGDILLAASF
jgi:hypothetical protein